jgi:AbrB family looped-hinge helix DNA binding protein
MLKLKKNSYKLSADSRLTIPKAFRDYWKLQPGDKIRVEMQPGGGVILVPAASATRKQAARKPNKNVSQPPKRRSR